MPADPTAASGADPALWSIASDLPGRLRILSGDLRDSPLLRSHCRQVLSGCHWLERFRINALAGSLCITYCRERRDELDALLEQALNLSSIDQAFAALLIPRFGSRRVRVTLTHAAGCLALIGLEGSLAVPAAAMTGLAALLLWPLLRRVVRELRRRELSLESIELTFSSLMVQQGLMGEALLDLAIGDAVDLAQSAVEPDSLHLDTDHLLERLGGHISLHGVTPAGEVHPLPLREVGEGQMIRLCRGETTFVSAHLLGGALIVVNRLLDGDWQPRQLKQGDTIEAGALILNGEAEARVAHGFGRDPAYALLHAHPLGSAAAAGGDGARWVDLYKRVIPPLQLGLGGGFLAIGSVDAALASLQFNALNDWEEQKLASQLTTIADLRMHRLQARSGPALKTIGSLRHLIISLSCLEGIGAIQWRESFAGGHAAEGGDGAPGSLLALLAGIQAWICGREGPALWLNPEQQTIDPVAVSHVAMGPLQEGWRITGENGEQWTLRQRQEETSERGEPQGFELELWSEGVLRGRLIRCSEPDHRWLQGCRQLRALGIEIHVVGADGAGPLRAVADALGCEATHIHTAAGALERWQLVKDLQQGGAPVGYMGAVLQDLSALEQADVSIGLDVDENSRHLAGICDLSLGHDILWLPRLIRISRGLQQTSRQNFALVGISQTAASLATAVGWIGPLQMVLLSDLPLLLAELNNLLTLQAASQPGHRPSPAAQTL